MPEDAARLAAAPVLPSWVEELPEALAEPFLRGAWRALLAVVADPAATSQTLAAVVLEAELLRLQDPAGTTPAALAGAVAGAAAVRLALGHLDTLEPTRARLYARRLEALRPGGAP